MEPSVRLARRVITRTSGEQECARCGYTEHRVVWRANGTCGQGPQASVMPSRPMRLAKMHSASMCSPGVKPAASSKPSQFLHRNA
jgi:hypothetical protein